MNKLILFLTLFFVFFLSGCKDGSDGKAFMSLVWTDISADTIFVSENSQFPAGDSVSQIMRGSDVICTVKAYNSNFNSLKGVEYEVDPGTFSYGTITSGIVNFNQIEITINEGEPMKKGEILYILPANGDDGKDKYYTGNLDYYTFIP